MNRILLTATLFSTLTLLGCSKNKKDAPNDPAGKYYFTAKADGVQKMAETTENAGMHAQVNYNDATGNVLLISGRWRISDTDPLKVGGIDLMVQGFPKKAGTYMVGQPGLFNAITYWVDMSPPSDREDDDIYSAWEQGGSGKIIIESFDGKEIRGTFESTVVNPNRKTVKITEGKFYMQVDMSRAQ